MTQNLSLEILVLNLSSDEKKLMIRMCHGAADLNLCCLHICKQPVMFSRKEAHAGEKPYIII